MHGIPGQYGPLRPPALSKWLKSTCCILASSRLSIVGVALECSVCVDSTRLDAVAKVAFRPQDSAGGRTNTTAEEPCPVPGIRRSPTARRHARQLPSLVRTVAGGFGPAASAVASGADEVFRRDSGPGSRSGVRKLSTGRVRGVMLRRMADGVRRQKSNWEIPAEM